MGGQRETVFFPINYRTMPGFNSKCGGMKAIYALLIFAAVFWMGFQIARICYDGGSVGSLVLPALVGFGGGVLYRQEGKLQGLQQQINESRSTSNGGPDQAIRPGRRLSDLLRYVERRAPAS